MVLINYDALRHSPYSVIIDPPNAFTTVPLVDRNIEQPDPLIVGSEVVDVFK